MEGMELLGFRYDHAAARPDLLADEDWQAVELALLANPRAGATVAGTGGARKLRIPLAGRGNRGGARTIYYYATARGTIHFLLTYAKNEQEDLTAEQRRAIRARVAQLKGEG